jgi:pimeloyl-ACP methyl ester carboxylesterase
MRDYATEASFALEHPERPGLIVALHGLTGSRSQPLALLHGLDDRAWGVLAPDMRAHGETRLVGPPEKFTPAQLARDVVSLLEGQRLTPRRIVVLGISLGATVALEIVRQRALELAGCAFVRPAHGSAHPAHLDVNLEIARYLREDPATALKRLLASSSYRAIAAASASGAANLRQKVAKDLSVERVMRLERGSWVAFGQDERVEPGIPTLVLAAEKDPLHPVAIAREWHRRIAQSQLVVAPSRDDDPDGNASASRAAIQDLLRRAGDPRKRGST